MKSLRFSVFLALYSGTQAFGCPPTEVNASAPTPKPAPPLTYLKLTEEEKKHPYNILVFGGKISLTTIDIRFRSDVNS